MTVHCLDALDFARGPCPEGWDLGWLDPPYIRILKKLWDRKFTPDRLLRTIEALTERAAPHASLLVCQGVGKDGDHPIFDVVRGIEGLGWKYRNWITWSKRRGYGTQRNYLFTREEILFFSRSDSFIYHPLHTAELRGYAGWNKDYPAKSEFKRVTNVWTDIPEIMRPDHEAEKPTKLCARALKAHSNQGSIVIDPYSGSASMGAVCAGLSRIYHGCDNDPEWAEKGAVRYAKALLEPPSEEDLDAHTGPLPDDYDACDECGFDHMYEAVEARAWHLVSRRSAFRIRGDSSLRAWRRRIEVTP